jgi:hypothetical protein
VSKFTRQPRFTDNFSQIPHGLWTAELTWGAKCLLGWLHSHDEKYLSSLSNNRIRNELGASGSVSGWISELVEAGFIRVEKHGQRNKFILLARPWERLACRGQKDDETQPAEKRPVEESPDEPAEKRPVSDRLPAGNQPKNGYIEDHGVDHGEHQITQVSDITQEAEILNASEIRFITFWRDYPRSEGKQPARRAWAKLSEAEQRAAVEAVPVHVEHWRRDKTERKFIPHAATWLNQRRWEDEFETDYQPDGSLVGNVIQYALNKQREERHDTGRSASGARELGSGHYGLE